MGNLTSLDKPLKNELVHVEAVVPGRAKALFETQREGKVLSGAPRLVDLSTDQCFEVPLHAASEPTSFRGSECSHNFAVKLMVADGHPAKMR